MNPDQIAHIDYVFASRKFIATLKDGTQFEPSQELLDEVQRNKRKEISKFMARDGTLHG